jgi:hypothetical protein
LIAGRARRRPRARRTIIVEEDAMTTRILSRSGGPTVLLAALTLAIACERPKELRVPLDYRPTDRLAVSALRIAPGTRVAVRTTDQRTDAAAIGSNTENPDKPVPIYPALPPPDTFVQDAVSRELANAGLTVEKDPKAATKILTLDLKRFWTDETSTYQATIIVDANLTGMTGRSFWRGQVTGTNKRFGRSLSPENYQESYSDAVVDLVQNLLRNPTFVEALNAPPTHTPEPRRRRRPG